jgi:hypothetical protein
MSKHGQVQVRVICTVVDALKVHKGPLKQTGSAQTAMRWLKLSVCEDAESANGYAARDLMAKYLVGHPVRH